MLGEFLAGVIIGTLLGLALAPVLRSWVLWQMAKEWRDEPRIEDRRITVPRREP